MSSDVAGAKRGLGSPGAVPSDPVGTCCDRKDAQRPPTRCRGNLAPPVASDAARSAGCRNHTVPTTAAAAVGAWFGVVRVIEQQGNGCKAPRRSPGVGRLLCCHSAP